MSKPINRFMEQTITNFSKAIRENNPDLTWAVLYNLGEVLNSYIDQSWIEKQQYEKQTNKEGTK